FNESANKSSLVIDHTNVNRNETPLSSLPPRQALSSYTPLLSSTNISISQPVARRILPTRNHPVILLTPQLPISNNHHPAAVQRIISPIVLTPTPRPTPRAILPSRSSILRLTVNKPQSQQQLTSTPTSHTPAHLQCNSLLLGSQLQQPQSPTVQEATIARTQEANESRQCTRLAKKNFQLNNIQCIVNYKDVFDAICDKYPLSNSTINAKRGKKTLLYLCVADLQVSDYKYQINQDVFNDDIKANCDEIFVESGPYKRRNDLKTSQAEHKNRQNYFAAKAFNQNAAGIAMIKENLPYDFLIHSQQIKRTLYEEEELRKKQKKLDYQSKYPIASFVIPQRYEQEVQLWFDNDFMKRINGEIDRCRCLFIVGDTLAGKTSWARIFGNHMFFHVNFSLKEWCDDALYLVLDDVKWYTIRDTAKGLLKAPGDVCFTGNAKKMY
ncbi:unnamed protein product, partial [Didymodactylos carnosus]